jgi:nucleoside-diphosphate-sugar epimerase
MTRQRRIALVTGATGFVGKHCVPALLARGFEVIGVTSSVSGDVQPGVRWRTCELRDPRACAALVDEEHPSHLLHLAWVTTPGAFWTSHENLQWLVAGVRLVDAFYASEGRRAVVLGSCAEYAVTAEPCVEDVTPIAPETVYGKAKASMHLALQAAAQDRGEYAWARLFFPYGPGEAGERFIPSVIRGLLDGETVACTHGNQVRDFIYVADAAEACVALLDSDGSGAYNVGSGVAASLRNVAGSIVSHLGRGDLVRFGARATPAYDPPCIVADVTKLKKRTGWTPRTSLADGLLSSIAAQRAEHVKQAPGVGQ